MWVWAYLEANTASQPVPYEVSQSSWGSLFPSRYPNPSVTAASISLQGFHAGCSLTRSCPWLYCPKPVRLWLEPHPKSYSPLCLVELVSTVRHEEFYFIKQNSSA